MMTKTCSKPSLGSRCRRGTDVSRCFTRPEICSLCGHRQPVPEFIGEATLHRAPADPRCDLRINQTDHAEQSYIRSTSQSPHRKCQWFGVKWMWDRLHYHPRHGAATPRGNGEPPVLPSPYSQEQEAYFDATRAPRTESQQLTLVGRPVRAGQLGANGPAMPHIACDDRRNGHHSGGADSAHLVANPAPPNISFMMPLGSVIL